MLTFCSQNDLLTWMLEDARRTGAAHPDSLLVQAILGANFAAIHTSTIVRPCLSSAATMLTTSWETFTHALYHLAANPEYAQPLREEIERVIAEDGWTKASTSRMWKLDSFLKESQRMNGVSARQSSSFAFPSSSTDVQTSLIDEHNTVSVTRRAQRDITLSDGTFLPKGTLVSGALNATHLDGDNFADATKFDGFRFARLRTVDVERGASGSRHLYVSTSPRDIGFGLGRQAWCVLRSEPARDAGVDDSVVRGGSSQRSS